MADRPAAPPPALSEGAAREDFSVPFGGQLLAFRAGHAFTAHRELRAFLDANRCPVKWSKP